MSGMAHLRKIQNVVGRLNITAITRSQHLPKLQNFYRTVNTSGSQKSKSTSSIDQGDQCKPKKPWVSYGFSTTDQELDKNLMHLTLFTCISVGLTFGAFTIMYSPDFKGKDWALREAYLELRRRESLGLPLIDPNLIDPAKVILPTDEELGDRDIII